MLKDVEFRHVSETEQGLEWFFKPKLKPKLKPNCSIESTPSASLSASVCGLFAQGNSVPFIARYRRPLTGGMTPDDLRWESNQYRVQTQSVTVKLVKVIQLAGYCFH